MTLPAPPNSLDAMVAQLLFPRFGSNMPPETSTSDDEERVTDLVRNCPVGGLCLFRGSWPASRDSLARLQATARCPMLVGADVERGAGQQIAGWTLFPHLGVFETIEDEADRLLEQFAEVLARESRISGLHVAFAPVADIQSEPRNPIIAIRSFGRKAEPVAHHVRRFIETCQRYGLWCTAKHFPGHGHTSTDSHDSEPRVDASREELFARELQPFRAAIAAQCRLIMTAHVSYPALDPTRAPATVSRPILTDLLRRQLQFPGLIVSDSLQMAGVRARFDSEIDLCLAALEAGVDILLDVQDLESTWEGIVRAVRVGRLARSRVEESFERVWRLKEETFGAGDASAASATPAIDPSEGSRLALRLARRAIRTYRPETSFATARSDLEPVADGSPQDRLWGAGQVVTPALGHWRSLGPRLGVAIVPSHPTPEQASGQALLARLRQSLPEFRAVEVGRSDESVAEATSVLASCGELIAVLIIKPAAWRHFGLSSAQDRFLQEITRRLRTWLVSLGVDHVLHGFPLAHERLCAYSDVPASQIAVAEYLLGTDSTPTTP